jgi:hypothetical protein
VVRSATNVDRPTAAVWCPTSKIAPRQSGPNSPASHSFDARTLLGQSEGSAALTARKVSCLWRVIERDGRPFALTADAKPDRIDVAISHGTVTSVGVY